MKNLKMILPALLAFFMAFSANGQDAIATTTATTAVKTETFKVLGNCGMCQKTIQNAAVKAGATTADWDKELHVLTVSFDGGKTNVDKIQEAIAKTGYDTPKYKASDAAYNKLHGCCQFDRTESLDL